MPGPRLSRYRAVSSGRGRVRPAPTASRYFDVTSHWTVAAAGGKNTAGRRDLDADGNRLLADGQVQALAVDLRDDAVGGQSPISSAGP